MITGTIETTVHGRYLYEDRGPELLLAGFHGYAELAEANLAEMGKLPGIERWSLVAIQALHPFYTRSGQLVASWMTRLDREHAIADNVAYVGRVLDALPGPQHLVFLGFSQGAAMAARAAAYARRSAGLIVLGGDIPPEIKDDPSIRLPPVLLARGVTDDWYTETKFKDDLRYLEATTHVTPLVFEGGHEWTDAFRAAAGNFLRGVAGS
jgi:predicted esterase